MKALVKQSPEVGIWMEDIPIPKGKARIRVQISAGMEKDHINRALDAFIKVGQKLKVI